MELLAHGEDVEEVTVEIGITVLATIGEVDTVLARGNKVVQ